MYHNMCVFVVLRGLELIMTSFGEGHKFITLRVSIIRRGSHCWSSYSFMVLYVYGTAILLCELWADAERPILAVQEPHKGYVCAL